MEVEIFKTCNRAFLRIGDNSVEVKDYRISSSMHGDMKLEVVIEVASDFIAFLSKANSE